ncbi:Minichromosome maintenance complex component 3 associated protein, partial [Caligus rogercresseyi]
DSLFKSEEPPPLFKNSKKNPFSFKSAPPQQPPLPQYSSSSSLACNSDQERYDTLSARNTQLRKANEGEPRESLIGDCPDMCPETERYRRAIQNQLRVYERRRDGSANHKAIVKEYSRSSADQEFPLSSELRPGRLLSQTMDHILCNIVDRIDVNRGSIHEWFDYLEAHGSSNGFQPCSETRDDIGEWFEFLWSATRAIRKDITQQRLVDLGAVDLVEKCARFHIVCSERLVQAESKDFSLKLNDENLTKCLQTLQHLYYDLDLEGVSCPNESEFRCYEILMNANSGKSYANSGPVRFGLKIVYALHSNNYSCILLRYFNQVRSKAVQTFVKAFCSSKIETKFELSHLTNMLGFEDEIEASGFLLAHGITVEGVLVHINKSDFCFPEEAPIIRRPINRVECKKKSD